MRRLICWLLGHEVVTRTRPFRDCDENLYFRPVMYCERCGRRRLA